MFEKHQKVKIGLDIGDAFVKVIQLTEKEAPGNAKPGKYEVMGFGVSRIAGVSSEAKINSIKSAIKDAGITANKVNSAVSGQSVIVRYISLPKMNKSELERAAKFEAEKYLPFDINDVTLDSHILEPEASGTKMRVLLVAAKKKLIDEHVELLKGAGLIPELIDIDSFSLINSFELAYPELKDTVALINVGSKFTNINIMKNYVSYFMRDIAIGGNEIIKTISDKLGVDIKQAEELAYNPKERLEEISKLVAPIFNNLAGEISLSFDYYENQIEQTISQVYLSGGASSILNLDKFLAANASKPIVLWGCTDKLAINERVNKDNFKAAEHMLSVAIGLALAPRKE